MIALRGVTVRFGDRVVLDRLDLELADGSLAVVTGPNGSGKTTLARVLLGLSTPSSGVVVAPARLRRAAVFQEDRLCGQLSAVANVRLGAPRGVGRAVAAARALAELEQVGLDRGDHGLLATPVRELSGGQRRRVAMVRAVAADADLLVLDEPFTGVDAESRDTVREYVRGHRAGRTTVLITHDHQDAEWFGARWDGRVVQVPSSAWVPGRSAPRAAPGAGQ